MNFFLFRLAIVLVEKIVKKKMCEANDDDLCIPRSAMYKLVKELVPQVRLSGEAKDLIVTCCNEFIHLLASEANTVCEKQSKKLILPDHVLVALDNLGFGEYKNDCLEVMKQMQEETDKRKKLSNKIDKSGIPEEELLRQQNELFAEARRQQEMMNNVEEWSKVQQAAQQALQRQLSACSTATAASTLQSPLPQLQHQQQNPFATNNSILNRNESVTNENEDDDDDNYD